MRIVRIVAAIWILNLIWGLIQTRLIFNMFVSFDDAHALAKTCAIVAVYVLVLVYNLFALFHRRGQKLFSAPYVICVDVLSAVVTGLIVMSSHIWL
ncbi:MAG: hypothetical protein PHI85_10340 [Victivallaceae bacterium]|nr:hypothetical protein [Victivallaceae bacterium]